MSKTQSPLFMVISEEELGTQDAYADAQRRVLGRRAEYLHARKELKHALKGREFGDLGETLRSHPHVGSNNDVVQDYRQVSEQTLKVVHVLENHRRALYNAVDNLAIADDHLKRVRIEVSNRILHIRKIDQELTAKVKEAEKRKETYDNLSSMLEAARSKKQSIIRLIEEDRKTSRHYDGISQNKEAIQLLDQSIELLEFQKTEQNVDVDSVKRAGYMIHQANILIAEANRARVFHKIQIEDIFAEIERIDRTWKSIAQKTVDFGLVPKDRVVKANKEIRRHLTHARDIIKQPVEVPMGSDQPTQRRTDAYGHITLARDIYTKESLFYHEEISKAIRGRMEACESMETQVKNVRNTLRTLSTQNEQIRENPDFEVYVQLFKDNYKTFITSCSAARAVKENDSGDYKRVKEHTDRALSAYKKLMRGRTVRSISAELVHIQRQSNERVASSSSN